MQKLHETDMCSGPVLGKFVRLLIPLIISGMLQLAFNAMDMIVVGNFTGSTALAAVGATTYMINIQVNLFIGISIGANVTLARYVGAKRGQDIFETIHTSMLMALIGGFLMILICNVIARPVLTLIGTPDDIIEYSLLYIRIYFCGMPFLMIYNFGAAILRAVGDTKRPLYYLTIAGVVNVLFNLLFVIVFGMGVAGVAFATVISQGVSAVLVVRTLLRSQEPYTFYPRKMKLFAGKTREILTTGISAGLQSVIFNISNLVIQSSVNSFGSLVVAGNTAANNIEQFIFVTINSTCQTGMSFIGQNMGAKKIKRARRIFWESNALIFVLAGVLGVLANVFGRTLLGLYTSDAEVVEYGMIRLGIVAATYGINGVQNVLESDMRALGYPVVPVVISIFGSCAVRILWVIAAFGAYGTLEVLYMAYPVSWIVIIVMNMAFYLFVVRRKLCAMESKP